MNSINELLLSLDTDVESYEEEQVELKEEQEDVVFTIPVPVVNLTKNLETDEWMLSMNADELNNLYHHIRDVIIYGEEN